MGKYTDIKCNYIQQKIKETSWKNRRYINMLLLTQKYIKVGRIGLGSAHILHDFKSKHSEDYEAIWQELEPKEYARIKKAELESEKREIEISKVREKEAEALELAEKEDWALAGGKTE